MRSEIFRFLLGVTLMLVVSALLAFNALLVWVATGPRSLAVVTPYIESALSSVDGEYEVKIGETKLIWDGWKHPVDIRIYNVTVFTGEGQVFTKFPEIALSVDILYLPLGRIMPASLTISAPQMNLVQNYDRSFGFGFKQADVSAPTVPLATLLAPFLSQDAAGNFSRLNTLIIRDAGLSVSNSEQKVFFDAKELNLTLSRGRKGDIKISSAANIFYQDYSSSLRTEFSMKPDKSEVAGVLEFSEVRPDILASLFSDSADVKSFAVPVSGKVNLLLSTDMAVKYLGFNINGGKGNIVSERLTTALPITSLQVRGNLYDNFREAHLEYLSVDMDGMKLNADAITKFFDMVAEPQATPEIKANISLKNMEGDRVKNLWPLGLSPMTREWVTENISNGKIPEARLTLNLQKGDLSKKILPKEAVDANIDVEGLRILYLPEHPPVTGVKGKIHIDGLGLLAEIDSADYLEKTKLSKGQLLIEDLNADNPYIKVDLHADAPAKDIVHFLGLPRLKHAEHLGLKEAAVTGNVKGEAKVGFNFFAPKGMSAEDAIVYYVKAEVAGISQKDFMHKFDISGAGGTVIVNNKFVEFAGYGGVNGADVSKGNIKYLFAPEDGFDTFMEVTANAGMDSVKRFGYPTFSFVKGNIGVSAKAKFGDNIEQAEATLNLTDTDINFMDVSWKKERGEGTNLELVTEKKDGVFTISSFDLNGKKTSVKGSAVLSADLSEIASVQIKESVLGDSDVSSINYIKNAGGILLEATGKSVDLTGWMEKDGGGFSFMNFPALQLKANIGKLILGKERILSGFKGGLLCDRLICHNADFRGATGTNKNFTAKIVKDIKNQRTIAVRSEDAGSFLRAIGVIEGMNGGVLFLNGSYKGNDASSILVGKISVTEHTVKDAPVLGKILSLASLTGFFDALAGNGIRFKELSIPFTLHKDVITLEKGKIVGSALGITVDGTITFPKKNLDLQGTVVPSYSLNSVFGKIPLFGEILTGGEGQGVFAARYSIKGLESNAEVSVNPLSILTPGFLRGLFDIFDEKKPTSKKIN